jgi:hypothetical protein
VRPSHLGGYDPFSYDVTKWWKQKNNYLFIEVHDPTEQGTANAVGKHNSNKNK